MTTAVDISKLLPTDKRKQFEFHYARIERIAFEFHDGTCSRCGAVVLLPSRETHELWHKNASCQVWLLGDWTVEHLGDHVRDTKAFQALIGNILGFLDPEHSPAEEEHSHEDGTVHSHGD